MSAHTEGRLKVVTADGDAQIQTPDDRPLAQMWRRDDPKANARRLAACWNACEGVSTEWLEAEKQIVLLGSPIADRFRQKECERDELVKALLDSVELLEGWINRYCAPRHRAEHIADLEKKRALLAKHKVPA